MKKILSVALTGGIGTGKSTVTSKFHALGTPIIDSDIISRSIVEPGKPCLDAIIGEFGKNILDLRGEIHRRKLRKIIFNDSEAKKKLENILHPVIYKEIDKEISNIDYAYCLIAIPLLIETRATDRFDRILLIDVTEKKQLLRASKRDKASIKYISETIKNQTSRNQRLHYADDIIDNNNEVEKLDYIVEMLHKKYLRLSESNKC
jgi:dephospho-CoA kinase|tara:strand:- start:155 stop:769 length:615 start_codon:yes stop_codon:yes gene_type:complete